MANSDHLLQLAKGRQAWNEWRALHPALSPDLSGADLSQASLQGYNLNKANLREANLRGADLRQANLQYADLRKANLREADLEEADLTGAILEGAVLTGANLSLTRLDGRISVTDGPAYIPPPRKKKGPWWTAFLKKTKSKVIPEFEEEDRRTFRYDPRRAEEPPEESGAEPPESGEVEKEEPGERTAPPLPPVAPQAPPPVPPSPEPETAMPVPEELKIVEPLPGGDTVSCSIYAPPRVEKGGALFIQVWAHLPEYKEEAEAFAKDFDETASLRQFKTLTAPLERGDEVTFVLSGKELDLADNTQKLIWTGQTESVQFDVDIPEDFPKTQVLFTVAVFKNTLPLGQLKFRIQVEDAGNIPSGQAPAQPLGEEVRRFKKAFVSYSSKDRPEVLRRVQMLGIFDVDYFMDLLSLDPGERWEKALYKNIDQCDVFLLFWSSHAKASQWVLKELEYAIHCKQGEDDHPPFIQPVPIEGPPIVPPPPQLGHMQFNDKILYFLLPYPG